MRVRHFQISCELLAHVLATGVQHNVRISLGLPDDARVRGAFTEGETITLVVESREYAIVPANQAPPLRSILIEDRRAAAAMAS